MNSLTITKIETILINPRKIAISLALIWTGIVLYATTAQFYFYLSGSYLPGTTLTDLNAEFNIPAIFSGLMLLLTSFFLGIIYMLEKNKPNNKYWLILSCGFFYMFVDEIFSIHEKFNPIIQKFIGHDHLGFFKFSWIIPYSIISILFGLYFFKFIFSLPKTSALRFIVSGSIYLSAVIGIEGFSGKYADIHDIHNMGYMIHTTIEEALEMYAICLFIYALLRYIQEIHPGLTISMQRE